MPDAGSYRDRRKFIKTSAFAGAAALGGCVESIGGSDNTTLSVASGLPEGHVMEEGFKDSFQQTILENSGDTVEFENYPGGQLGGLGEAVRMARDNVADIVYAPPTVLTDELPLSNAFTLPGFDWRDTVRASRGTWESIKPGSALYEAEYAPKNIRPVGAHLIPPMQVYTTEPKLDTIDDWEGTTIGTSGAPIRGVENLGGAASQIPPPEYFSSLQQGTIDGVLAAPHAVLAYGIEELVNYGTTNVNLGNYVALWIMSDENYSKLSDDVQTAIEPASKNLAEYNAKALEDAADKRSKRYVDEFGVDLFDIADDELSSWEKRLSTARDEWIQDQQDPDIASDIVSTFDQRTS